MADEQEFWNRMFDEPSAPGPKRTRTVPRGAFTARPPSIVERVLARARDWRSDARFGVVVLVAVAVVAGVVWYRVGIGGGSEAGAAPRNASSVERTTRPVSAPTTSPATTSAASASSSARITVHVAGAVARPGVVELGAGARVIDAVEAVGGAHADADLDRLNLAAKLADGERVYVPKVGEADPGVVTGGDASATGTGTSGGTILGGKVNLNTATDAQLEDLPGIGPTYAQSIIAERQRRGGFKSVNELRGVRGIGDKRFAELAPLVTV